MPGKVGKYDILEAYHSGLLVLLPTQSLCHLPTHSLSHHLLPVGCLLTHLTPTCLPKQIPLSLSNEWMFVSLKTSINIREIRRKSLMRLLRRAYLHTSVYVTIHKYVYLRMDGWLRIKSVCLWIYKCVTCVKSERVPVFSFWG